MSMPISLPVCVYRLYACVDQGTETIQVSWIEPQVIGHLLHSCSLEIRNLLIKNTEVYKVQCI